jgi:hypothetical protein
VKLSAVAGAPPGTVPYRNALRCPVLDVGQMVILPSSSYPVYAPSSAAPFICVLPMPLRVFDSAVVRRLAGSSCRHWSLLLLKMTSDESDGNPTLSKSPLSDSPGTGVTGTVCSVPSAARTTRYSGPVAAAYSSRTAVCSPDGEIARS